MDRRLYPDPVIHEHQEEHPEFEPENAPDSPFSEDEAAKISVPSPKKWKSVQKRVVSVQIGGDGNGARSKGESYPPPDSWSWRKYGQKPIKGSPYPRGYYRCSNSKGCPARKQVERSRVDPTVLLITYSSDHNHHRRRGRPAAESHPTAADSPPAEVSADDLPGFSCHPDVGSDPLLDLDWLAADVASTSLLESPVWASESRELGVDVASACGMMREEDETLFGDLGELPECTAVFGRRKEVAE